MMRVPLFLALLVLSDARTLTVCTKSAPPFSIRSTESPRGWTGFSWEYLFNDILHRVRETSNVRDFQIVDCTDNNNALRRVGLGEIDLAHAAITKTSAREDIVDFTNTWFISGFRVLVRQNNDFFATIGRIMATLGTAIGLFAAVLVVLTLGGAMILSVAEMASPGPIDPWDTDTYFSNLSGAATVIQNTLLPGSGSIIEPYGFYSKPVLSVFKSFGAVLPPILTALITMVLVLNNSSNVIGGMDDLQGMSVIVPSASTAESYMRNYHAGVRRIVVPDVNTMFARFAEGEGNALVYDWPILISFMNQQKAAGDTTSYEMVGAVFQEQQYGIAVSPRILNSTDIREALNKAILETWETDQFKLLENKWIHSDDVSLTSQVQSANTQLIALLITGSFVMGLGILVTMVWCLSRYICCTSASQTGPQSRSVRSLGNVIKETLARQSKYARRLPPNTLTYANWEMLSSIANFLKEWKPVASK